MHSKSVSGLSKKSDEMHSGKKSDQLRAVDSLTNGGGSLNRFMSSPRTTKGGYANQNHRGMIPEGTLSRHPGMFQKPKERPSIWVIVSWILSCCFPSILLKSCGISQSSQQAWREKWALCVIAFLLSTTTLFFFVFFNNLACPGTLLDSAIPINVNGGVVIFGTMYRSDSLIPPFNTLFEQTDGGFGGVDVSEVFARESIPACTAPDVKNFAFATFKSACEQNNSCLNLTALISQQGFQKFTSLRGPKNETINFSPIPAYDWKEIMKRKYVALGANVLNFQPYFNAYPVAIQGDEVDAFMRLAQSLGDANHILAGKTAVKENIRACLIQKYNAGMLKVLPASCIVSRFISWSISGIILLIVISRFLIALAFSWFYSTKLSQNPKEEDESFKRASILDNGFVPIRNRKISHHGLAHTRKNPASFTPLSKPSDIYTMILITCYSEGEESLKSTLDSVASTDYDDAKKLLFVVADGLVKGKENDRTTPDILISLMNHDTTFGRPLAQSYLAIGHGKKQLNMARVYCGSYHFQGRAIPMILIVKCGIPAERRDTKPGNRGKRDSQLILMNFCSRVTLNDRMTPLDFDLFQKIHHISGVTPDFYESVLMVDADTSVDKLSLRYLTNALHADPMIIGLCGETRVANKRASWVSRIQVFEYFISHHMGKGFESWFGNVTCLPGCFSMWKITSQSKDGLLIPILGNPDIIEQYSANEVYTLHQKNLLLLGEDRFLTTIMLKQFANRKLVYVPQAVCKTQVPDDFKTLLSQRRRWINSTIHNLMELVFVDTLCGTFCFSMQFIVLMDLLSTATLPASLLATYYLLFTAIFKVQYNTDSLTTIILTATMVLVMFLPGFLVLMSGRKISYLGWMMLYFLSLPIWQIVLPLYSFWNFDDFSWGETRKVEGETVDKGHGTSEETTLLTSSVPLKRWDEYERERRQFIVNRRMRNS